jgi:AAA15 family ATPase/GTPase
MLKLFEVTGFKNFKDKIRLDFSDVRDYRFNNSCLASGSLKEIIVYGKNSVGKSNLGLALFDIVAHLTNNNITPGLYDYYMNADNKIGYVEFHYVLTFGIDEIDYIYRKDENQELIFEELHIGGILQFKYDYKNNRGDISTLKELVPTLNFDFRGGDSILKYVIVNSSLGDKHPLYQMHRFVSRMLWFRSLDDNRYIGYKTKSNDYFDFIFDDKMLRELEAFLRKAGINERLTVNTDADGKRRLYFDHEQQLPFFKVASSGTKALYTFFYWYKTAVDVSVMFIDEFDAFYHYELAEAIVDILGNTQGVQAILTSHNTNLLSNRIMRPDCYFILTDGKLTSVANATGRELREGHNLEKLYFSGEFDA